VKLARGEKAQTNQTVNNGKIEVPSILLDPIIVDKENLETTVISDGYQKREDIFRK